MACQWQKKEGGDYQVSRKTYDRLSLAKVFQKSKTTNKVTDLALKKSFHSKIL